MDTSPSFHLLQKLSPLSLPNNSSPVLNFHNRKFSNPKKFDNSPSTQSTTPLNNPFHGLSSHLPSKSEQLKNFKYSLSPVKPTPPHSTKDQKTASLRHEVGLQNASGLTKSGTLKLPRGLEDYKAQASLPNIFPGDKLDFGKLENLSMKLNTETQDKIAEQMQKNFQKKELITPRLLPSRNSISEKPKANNAPTASPNTFRIKSINSPMDSPLKQKTERTYQKQRTLNGAVTARENDNAPSFSIMSARAQTEMAKLTKVNATGLSQAKGLQPSPPQKKRTLEPLSNFKTLQTETDEEEEEDPEQELNRLSEIKSPAQIANSRVSKLTIDQREKLNQMIQTKVSVINPEDASSESSMEEDNYDKEESIERIYETSKHVRKSTLKEAMAEYEKNFHERFMKKRRNNQFYERIELNHPASIAKNMTEAEKKWAQEMPLRRAFELAAMDGNFKVNKTRKRLQEEQKETPTKVKFDIPETSKEQNQESGREEPPMNIADRIVQQKFKRIRALLRARLIKYANLKISPQEIVDNNGIFPSKPYQKKHAEKFIKAAKFGNIEEIKVLLSINRYYIFEYDQAHQTALHWAVKRGHRRVCEMLLDYGADPDARNLGGRTPLYYGFKGKFPEIVRILLLAKADPWTRGNLNYGALDPDRRSQIYLNRARQISIILSFHPPKDRPSIWEKEAKNLLCPLPALGNEDDLLYS